MRRWLSVRRGHPARVLRPRPRRRSFIVQAVAGGGQMPPGAGAGPKAGGRGPCPSTLGLGLGPSFVFFYSMWKSTDTIELRYVSLSQ